MVDRKIESSILTEGVKYPIITITGPRQSGKTTLARKLFRDYKYVNLEEISTRQYAETDPAGFFKTYTPPVIIDEIQHCPSLLSQVQVLSDELGQKAQFVITGSQQLGLQTAVSQSLAGRTIVYTLLPFCISEIDHFGKALTPAEYILKGGMPRLFNDALDPSTYYRNYIQTYIERDVREISNIKSLGAFERFLTLLASRAASEINLSSLCDETGVTSTTLKEWLSVLEISHIAFTLKPWFKNIGKRLTKTPKVYFCDTGVACSLLSITDPARLETDRMYGRLFENLVINEALKARLNANQEPSLYFLRTQGQSEIDLIDALDGRFTPYEIKSSSTFNPAFLHNIQKLAPALNYTPDRPGGVIYSGEPFASYQGYRVLNYKQIGEEFGG